MLDAVAVNRAIIGAIEASFGDLQGGPVDVPQVDDLSDGRVVAHVILRGNTPIECSVEIDTRTLTTTAAVQDYVVRKIQERMKEIG
jgi:hypothetical protein